MTPNITTSNNINVDVNIICPCDRSGSGNGNKSRGKTWIIIIVLLAFVAGLFLWEAWLMLQELVLGVREWHASMQEYWLLNGQKKVNEIISYVVMIAIIIIGISTGLFILMFEKLRVVWHLNK